MCASGLGATTSAMRLALTLGVVIAACGEEPVPAAGELSWRFNYQDWTNPNAADDRRGCDNQPAASPGPAYSPITQVHVTLTDPDGQVPGIDRDEPCLAGAEGAAYRLVGLNPQTYSLTLTAKTAAGRLLYRYEDPALDLSAYRSEEIDLPAASGELRFFPRFSGSLQCPAGVASVRSTFYPYDQGVPTAAPNRQITHTPACEDSGGTLYATEVFAREIPITIAPMSGDTFNSYDVVVEALGNTGVVLHCAKQVARPLKLATASVNTGDPDLAVGACP